jgi:hypothetical protein
MLLAFAQLFGCSLTVAVSRLGDDRISAGKLFLWAILPTVIMGVASMLLR